MRQYNVNILLTNAIFFMFSRYPHFFPRQVKLNVL